MHSTSLTTNNYCPMQLNVTKAENTAIAYLENFLKEVKLDPKFNLVQYKKYREEWAERKHEVSEMIDTFRELKGRMPYYAIFMVINDNAHKRAWVEKNLAKGFKRENAYGFFNLIEAYRVHHGIVGQLNDVGLRVVNAWRKQRGYDVAAFNESLKAIEPMGNAAHMRGANYKALCKGLGLKVRGEE